MKIIYIYKSTRVQFFTNDWHMNTKPLQQFTYKCHVPLPLICCHSLMHITQGTENSICPTNHFIFELLNQVLKFHELNYWNQFWSFKNFGHSQLITTATLHEGHKQNLNSIKNMPKWKSTAGKNYGSMLINKLSHKFLEIQILKKYCTKHRCNITNSIKTCQLVQLLIRSMQLWGTVSYVKDFMESLKTRVNMQHLNMTYWHVTNLMVEHIFCCALNYQIYWVKTLIQYL
jgi:hypothetical protein